MQKTKNPLKKKRSNKKHLTKKKTPCTKTQNHSPKKKNEKKNENPFVEKRNHEKKKPLN